MTASIDPRKLTETIAEAICCPGEGGCVYHNEPERCVAGHSSVQVSPLDSADAVLAVLRTSPAPSPTPPSEPEVCLSPDECNLRPADVRARCVCVTHDDSEPADSSTSKARELADLLEGDNVKCCREAATTIISLCEQIERMTAALRETDAVVYLTLDDIGPGHADPLGQCAHGKVTPRMVRELGRVHGIAKRALSPPAHTQES